jgi:hypothetical protein
MRRDRNEDRLDASLHAGASAEVSSPRGCEQHQSGARRQPRRALRGPQNA